MPSIVPPLDFIPKLPGKGVELISSQIDIQLDRLFEEISNIIQDVVKLPGDCKCDDPRMKKIKDTLASIQEQITKIQEAIPKIQEAVQTIQTVVTTAQSIKAAITAAQLAIPATAGLFIAQQLMAIQDATIVNAIASLQQFSEIPNTITSRLATLIPPLLSAFNKVSSACNGDVDNLELPSDSLRAVSVEYNDLVSTEFYNELNVSDDDLNSRGIAIEDLIQQQRDLLSSLQEAPSKVYQMSGIPDPNLGKPGDYYVNLDNSQIYGPKLSATNWGAPANQ